MSTTKNIKSIEPKPVENPLSDPVTFAKVAERCGVVSSEPCTQSGPHAGLSQAQVVEKFMGGGMSYAEMRGMCE